MILSDLQPEQKVPTIIHCDNMSAIAVTKNLVFHSLSMHIEICRHFIRDLVNVEELQLEFVNTNEQLVDLLTKPVATEKFENFRSILAILN